MPGTIGPVIQTAVGAGEPGYSGDGGPATEARLNQPFHCCMDGAGNLFVADAFNHCVRRIDARTGVITTVAGRGEPGYSGDGGPATAARLREPYAVLVDQDGDLFVVDRLNAAVRRVDARTGVITTYAGTGEPGDGGDGGPADRALLAEPNAIDFDPAGDLYIADVRGCRIRKVARATGTITTVCGTGRLESSGDGGPAVAASLMGPRGVAFDPAGNMFVCEREGSRIRRVDARTGTIAAYAGTGARGYAGDGGPATAAVFDRPKWIHIGADGRLYVVDTENHCVRRIDPATGLIATVAGGRRGPDGDGGPAEQAGMNRPHGCWLDPTGRLYTADSENHRVRISTAGS
jgi:DNA-binding beta-propeller fold protein YncE